jgi:hypothetical protein
VFQVDEDRTMELFAVTEVAVLKFTVLAEEKKSK